MKKDKLPLFIFIDALGWEVLKAHPTFMEGVAEHRMRLNTILGYSSACDPSIISGLVPSQHLHWSSFYYSPYTCPYRWVKWLGLLPSAVTGHHRIRNKVSQLIKKVHGFTGYFQVYHFPFDYLPFFDYAEKESIWVKGGLRQGSTIFDLLADDEIPHYVDDSGSSDHYKFDHLTSLIEEQSIDFAYVLLGQLDAVMHGKGTRHPDVGELMEWYDKKNPCAAEDGRAVLP